MIETPILSETESTILEEMTQKDPSPRQRRRAMGILSLAAGQPVLTVATILRVSLQTVYTWGHDWFEKGLDSFAKPYRPGRPRKIAPEVMATAAALARSEPLTTGELRRRTLVAHPESCDFSALTLSRALDRAGFSSQRTRACLKKKGTPASSPATGTAT